MLDCFGHVAGAGLALGADHGSALFDAAQRLAQVPGATDEGHSEVLLLDVVLGICRREHLGLVDHVDSEGFEYFGLDEVADAGLGHHRDGDGIDDLLDDRGIGHAGDAAFLPDVGRHCLERHDCDCSGLLGDECLLNVRDVHDDPALLHFGEAALDQRRPVS